MAAAIGVGRFVYTPILPRMLEALGLSRSAAGLIASANFLGYLVGALLAALPGLRGSRRRWLLGALAVSAISTAGMGLTHDLPSFLVLRFVGGGASAFVLIFASTLVLAYLAEAGRSALSSLHFAGVGIGVAASAVLVAAMLDEGRTWESLWVASGALSLAGGIAVAALLPGRIAPARSTGVRNDGGTGGDSSLRLWVMAYGLFGFGYIITATFLVAIVRSSPAIRSLEPMIWIAFGLAAAPSVVLWNAVASRRGVPATFAIAAVVEAVGVLASVAWPSAAGVFMAAILVGGTFMGLTALGLVQARALATGDPGRALALMTVAFGLGQIIGPVFAGSVSDRMGSFTAPSIVAGTALLLAAVLARKADHARRPGGAEEEI